MDQELKGNLHGIKTDLNAPAITHLMYVDDLLVMCRANEKEAEIVKNSLAKYCSWASQEVNCEKSCIFFLQKHLTAGLRGISKIL